MGAATSSPSGPSGGATQLPLAPGGVGATGVLVCLGDKASPIVFQGAGATDYDSFSDFIEQVLSLKLEHDPNTGRAVFATLGHTALGRIADSARAPSINESSVDLAPPTMPLYSAPPRLEAAHGDAAFTVAHPGHKNLTRRRQACETCWRAGLRLRNLKR